MAFLELRRAWICSSREAETAARIQSEGPSQSRKELFLTVRGIRQGLGVGTGPVGQLYTTCQGPRTEPPPPASSPLPEAEEQVGRWWLPRAMISAESSPGLLPQPHPLLPPSYIHMATLLCSFNSFLISLCLSLGHLATLLLNPFRLKTLAMGSLPRSSSPVSLYPLPHPHKP